MVEDFIAEDEELSQEERSQLQEIAQVCKIKAMKNWSHVTSMPRGIL